ncbi:MAG: hypothetical protein ABEJ66_03370 [Candidatus Nanohaloarchaea archaeon]
MGFPVDFGDRSGELRPANEGGFNRKYISGDGELLYSLPRLGSTVLPVESSRDLVKYQRTLLENARVLEYEGFNVPGTSLVVGSHRNRDYPFIVSENREELVNGREEVVSRFSGGEVENPVSRAEAVVRKFLENDGGKSCRQLLEEGELVYSRRSPAVELHDYGFTELEPGSVWLLDLGEVPPEIPGYIPYSSPEMWDSTGISEAADAIMEYAGIEERDVRGEPLLSGP